MPLQNFDSTILKTPVGLVYVVLTVEPDWFLG